ncbi:MAG TPA: hypothetical protein VN969_10335 [Streptosporangiaceae bacterium]|nr:hypothetical protein [Streptosporangiaceae bacterium]
MPFVTSQQLYDTLIAADRGAGTASAVAEWPDKQFADVAGAAALDRLLLGRRSCRAYTDQPLAETDLTAIVNMAARAAVATWETRAQDAIGLSLVVCAYRVSGLGPGVFVFHPGTESGLAAPAGPWEAFPAEIGWPDSRLDELSQVYVTAPALILIYGTAERAGRKPGGYPSALMAASATAYAAWLASLPRGLACCMFGRAHPAIATLTLPDSAGARRQFATLAIGYAKEGHA